MLLACAKGMTVSTILRGKGSQVISAKPDDTLHDAARLMAKNRIGAVLVLTDTGGLGGVLSERDIVKALAQHGAEGLQKPVRAFMTAEVVTAGPHDTVEEVMERMTNGRFRHMPVMDEGRLVGMISIGDVVKRRIDVAENEAQALREYVSQAG